MKVSSTGRGGSFIPRDSNLLMVIFVALPKQPTYTKSAVCPYQYNTGMYKYKNNMYSVADPGYFDKDPDPIFHFDTNPDPPAVQKLSIIKMYGTVL
jgi:hypothetical protein